MVGNKISKSMGPVGHLAQGETEAFSHYVRKTSVYPPGRLKDACYYSHYVLLSTSVS